MKLIDEISPLRLYSAKKKVYIPFNVMNKKKGARIELLTKDLETSNVLMNLPYMYNPGLYKGYYIDKNVMAYINSSGIIDEEPDIDGEAIQEAIIHKASSDMVKINTSGSPSDRKELEDAFTEAKFKKWYKNFGYRKMNYPDVVVYGFNSLPEMAKSINKEAIIQDSSIVTNSYVSHSEIFVLNYSAYAAIESKEGPYNDYLKNAMITFCAYNTSDNCNLYLANQVGTALSGQADWLYKKADYNFAEVKDKIGPAICIKKLYEEKGMKEIKYMLHTGNYRPLVKYVGRKTTKAAIDIFDKLKHEAVIFEETKDFGDIDTIYSSLSRQEQRWLGDRSKHDPMKRIYRDVFYEDRKPAGFIEVYDISDPGNADSAGAVTIATASGFRGQGIAKLLVTKMIEEFKQKRRGMRLVWRCSDDNVGSAALAKSLGFDLVKDVADQKKFELVIENAVIQESVLLEAKKNKVGNGTHADCVRVYNAMSSEQQYFIAGHSHYPRIDEKEVVYRNVIKEGLFTVKGFVECTDDYACVLPNGKTCSVIIGVHPDFQGQGIGKQLVETLIKDIRKADKDIANIVWRANADNKTSQALAKACGFELVRKTDVQNMYRYMLDPIEEFKYLDPKVLNETDLVKWMAKNFKETKSLKESVLNEKREFSREVPRALMPGTDEYERNKDNLARHGLTTTGQVNIINGSTGDKRVSQTSTNPLELYARLNPEEIDHKKLEVIRESKDVVSLFRDYVMGLYFKESSKFDKIAEEDGGDYANAKKAVIGSMMWIDGDAEHLKNNLGFDDESIANYVLRNYYTDDISEKGIRKLIDIRIKNNNTLVTMYKEMLKLNYKALGLSEKEAEALIADLNDDKKQGSAMKKILDIINDPEKIKDFKIDDSHYDFRKLGFGVYMMPDDFKAMRTADTKKMIGYVTQYDCVVAVHGGENSKAEDNAVWKRSAKETANKGFAKFLSSYDTFTASTDEICSQEDFANDKDRIIFTCCSRKFIAFRNGKVECKRTLEVLDWWAKNASEDKLQELIDEWQPVIEHYGFDEKYPEASKLEPKDIVGFCKRYRKSIYDCIYKYIYKRNKNYDPDAEKERVWTCMEIHTLNGGPFTTVNELLRQLRKEGFKNVLLTACNPAHTDIAKDIIKDPNFSVRINRYNAMSESAEMYSVNEFDPDDEVSMNLVEAENGLIQLCEENNIDYFHDARSINECYEDFVALANTRAIQEGVIDALKELARKAIEVIVKIWRKILEFFGRIWDKIKSFFVGSSKSGTIKKEYKKKTEASFIDIKGNDAKVIEAKVESLDEVRKLIYECCDHLSAKIKSTSSTETQYINKMESDLAAGKFKKTEEKKEEESANDEQALIESYIITEKDKVRSVKDIMKTKTGNNFDAAYLAAWYLQRMGLTNLIGGFMEISNGNLVNTRFCTIFTYGQSQYYMIDCITPDCKGYLMGSVENPFDFHNTYNALAAYGVIDDELEITHTNFGLFTICDLETGKIAIKPGSYIVGDVIDRGKLMLEGASTSTLQPFNKRKISNVPLPQHVYSEGYREAILNNGYLNENNYMLINDDAHKAIYFFENGMEALLEADKRYDTKLRRYLYKERLRTNKSVLEYYDRVKAINPKIKKTFLKVKLYNKINIFVDLSYYNGIFLKNQRFVKDNAVRMYWDFMNRLLNDKDPEVERIYPKKTIFIPVFNGAWDLAPGSYIYDYRKNINPISVIFRMAKLNINELKEKWGGKDILFLSPRGYFKIDFKDFSFRELGKMKRFVTRLMSGEDIGDDEDEDGYGNDEDSTGGMVMKVTEKIEKQTGISIDNVSAAIRDPEAVAIHTTQDIPTLSIKDYKIPNVIDFKVGDPTEIPTAIGVLAGSEDEFINIVSNSQKVIPIDRTFIVHNVYVP